MPNLKEILELAERSRHSAEVGFDYWHGVADALEWATGNRQAAPGETPTDRWEYQQKHIAECASLNLSVYGPAYPPEDLPIVRREVHNYQREFGTDPNPQPPDDLVLEKLLAIATIQQLRGLMEDLRRERRKPGSHYSWYMSVASQRLHGIAPRKF